jgi:hypothetical protein
VRQLAFELLRAAPFAAIASDAHGLHRLPALSKAVVSLAAAGVPNPRCYAADHPRRLLDLGLSAGWTTLAA